MVAEVTAATKRLRTVGKCEVDDLLLSVVDETMKQIFKEEGTKVIYGYLENNSHLKRKEIAEKPKVFSAGLKKLLGSAAPVIERLILKNLYSNVGLKFKKKRGYGFSDYVKELEEECIYVQG